MQPVQTQWNFEGSFFGKQFGGSSKEKKKKRTCQWDLAIPLLRIHPDEAIIQKDIRMPVFTAALFTVAKTWRHGHNLNVHQQMNG